MNFNGFDYPQVVVDDTFHIFADLDGDGKYDYTETDIYAIESINGCEIAGAVTTPENKLPGFYIDIIETSPGHIEIFISDKRPIFAAKVANRFLDDGTGGRQTNGGKNLPQNKPHSLGTATGVAEQ